MKKYYFVAIAFLACQAVFSQNVYIPDPVFKQILLEQFDMDGDGEIFVPDEGNCQCSVYIDSPAITDLTGIESINAIAWEISNTAVTSIQASGISSDQFVSFFLKDNLLLESIDVSGSPEFQYITVENSPLLANLDLAGCTLLGVIIDNTGLTNLDLSAFPNLFDLVCENNTQLTSVACNGNQMGNVDCTYNPNLTEINFMQSQVSYVNCHHNKLQSLAISGFLDLNANDNEISELHIENNSLGGGSLNLDNNQLTELDLSNCGPFFTASANNNDDLAYINLKNGAADELLQILNVPALAYVCLDQQDIDNGLLAYLANVSANTYCSFTPGGNYNTIEGDFTFNGDGDGCETADPHFANSKIWVTQGAETEAVFTNSSGHYKFYTNAGNLTLTPAIENPSFFSVTPALVNVNFPIEDGSVNTQNFCVTPNGVRPDAEVAFSFGFAEPGFDAGYNIVLKNKGNQALSGTLDFTFDDTRLDFVSANPANSSASNGLIVFDYANLQPFETRHFSISLNVNSPQETPPVNIDDTFGFMVSTIVAGDETPLDNTFSATQTVVGSFDPNDKICIEGSVVSPERIGEYLHYLIRFENTGTANAHNIVVKDVIDNAQFDVSTLQLLETSHAVDARISGNKVAFIFEGIELVPEGDGHVLFKVKTLNSLAVGTTVSNKADIFFDYNFPIQTIDAETTFQLLGVKDLAPHASIAVCPNPASDIFSVKGSSDISSVQVYDAQGRLLQTSIGHSNEVAIDISSRARGIYFVKAFSKNGTNVVKVIKE